MVCMYVMYVCAQVSTTLLIADRIYQVEELSVYIMYVVHVPLDGHFTYMYTEEEEEKKREGDPEEEDTVCK